MLAKPGYKKVEVYSNSQREYPNSEDYNMPSGGGGLVPVSHNRIGQPLDKYVCPVKRLVSIYTSRDLETLRELQLEVFELLVNRIPFALKLAAETVRPRFNLLIVIVIVIVEEKKSHFALHILG